MSGVRLLYDMKCPACGKMVKAYQRLCECGEGGIWTYEPGPEHKSSCPIGSKEDDRR